ncbi:MAG: penicillin-binding protein 1C [Treponema sp.]|nr:penicillin-binding protein 1C [Treponema sp.]
MFVFIVLFAFSLPRPLFSSYYSPVLYDRSGKLLGAIVAYDGQWRFPEGSTVQPVNIKFGEALIEAEDRRFRNHVGIDFFSIGRAFVQNIRAGRIVSGGSTITMQTIRLSRSGRKRSIAEKILEAFLALRLEFSFSKDQILGLYGAHAPFGANVVGIEAASWRWFGRSSADLSWAEAATLAVLPNGPGLIHPGRNRELLREKRDALLDRLYARGLFDEETLLLARSEPLPGEPLPLPSLAPHLLARIVMEAGGVKEFNSENKNHPLYNRAFSLVTTIDWEVQRRASAILERWALNFAERGISAGACIILDTGNGEALAYVGNVPSADAPAVDIAASPRSSGSLLKPFLYGAMLDTGDILPSSLVSDIPTRVGSYSPENNSRTYLGVVRSDEALARSLNVPAVRSLRLYGVERFADLLRGFGITTLFRRGEDYGLPLILGGAEVTLWEITGLYAGLARSADPANREAFFPPRFFAGTGGDRRRRRKELSAGAAWLTLEALTFVTRPGEEAHWQEYAGSRRIAWKTGTSYGNRDAWAVGTTPLWTAGVWIGNASGEGRAELVSTATSAPVLFSLFSALDSIFASSTRFWFPQYAEEFTPIEICAPSGFPAGVDCEKTAVSLIPREAPRHGPCPYCRTVALNQAGDRRVTAGAGSEPVRLEKWFVLPPAEEWYVRRWNLDYKPLPALRSGPGDLDGYGSAIPSLALFNPEPDGKIYIPRELDGREGRVVFQAAHRDGGETIYWHLDDTYLGETFVFHELEARPGPGFHIITLVDGKGSRISRRFEVLSDAD